MLLNVEANVVAQERDVVDLPLGASTVFRSVQETGEMGDRKRSLRPVSPKLIPIFK